MNIFLIGFMGSGKSTVGKLLAEKLNLKFIDIDEEIEKQENKTISQIFKENGEMYFRNLEKQKIKEFQSKKVYVVSTGGGLGANKENMEFMKKNGIVIWLDVSLEEVLKRCKENANRPLLNQPLENLKKLYEKRKNVYSMAHVHIKTDGKSPKEITKEIIEKCKSLQV